MQPLPTGNLQAQMQHQPKIDSEFLNSATNTELKQVTEMFPWFQLAWLFYLKSLKKTGSPEFDVVLKKVAVIIANSKMVTSFINDETNENDFEWGSEVSTPTYLNDGKDEIDKSDSLIDKFLSKTNTLQRKSEDGKTERTNKFVNPEEQSSVESEEIITETLAKIYLDQKKYDKAEKAYKKLSLKFPEKSIYFASQIEKIEKLKDNNS